MPVRLGTGNPRRRRSKAMSCERSWEASDQEPALDPVQTKILEKKRLFHKNRFLELKNLPETVTEQVG